jgi:DNA-binding Lrp family transcriptional regulator
MCMAAVDWAWSLHLRSGPKLVLQCLAWHARQSDWLAYPGIETVARETGFSPRAVGQHLDALEREGFIKRERRHLTKGAAKGKRLVDAFLLVKEKVQSENTAGSLSENSADTNDGAIGKIRQPYPKNLQSLSADSASGYIRNEPREEPTSEPTSEQTVGRADDVKKIKRLRDDPLTRGKAELIFEAFGVNAASNSDIRSLARGIATLELQCEDAFEFYIAPTIKELVRQGRQPKALNLHWMMTEIAPIVHSRHASREEFRRELQAQRPR